MSLTQSASITPNSIIYLNEHIQQHNYNKQLTSCSQTKLQKQSTQLTPVIDEEYKKNPKRIHQKVQPLLEEDIQRVKDYFKNKPQRFKANTLRDYTWFVFAYHTGRRASDFTKIKVCDIMDENGNIRDFWNIEHEQKTGNKATVAINQYAREVLIEYFTYKQENNISYKMSDYCFVNYTTKAKRSDAIHKYVSVSFNGKRNSNSYTQTKIIKIDEIVTKLQKQIISDLTSLGYSQVDINNMMNIALKTNKIPYVVSERYTITEIDNSDTLQPLTTENVRTIMKRAAKEMGITYNVGSHTPRKTIGAMVKKYSDDPNAEELLCEFFGHASVKITRKYMEDNIVEQQILAEKWGGYIERCN